MTMTQTVHLLLGLLIFLPFVVGQECVAPMRQLSPSDKPEYTVGVLAIRGVESASNELNATFGDYLTQTAGKRFNPPISFRMVPVPFGGQDIVEKFTSGDYDFIYAQPAIQSCIATETGVSLVASVLSRRKVGGQVHHLTHFGGVIFTLASNTKVNSLQDLRGKRIATASISGLGSGQMQFRELLRSRINYLQDPAQIIFTGNQGKVVNLVLQEKVDVGFVRTDQLERSKDARTGELVDLSLIKIIDPKPDLFVGDQPFPFTASTTLYPDWFVTSLTHVPNAVNEEVRASLLAMDEHAAISPNLRNCYAMSNCSATDTDCFNECFNLLDRDIFQNCDSTPRLALQAQDAMTKGKFAGWRGALPLMDLRNMQEEIGFMLPATETLPAQCLRSTRIGDGVVCPKGHRKKSDAEIETNCEDLGIDCHGFACICSPCEEIFVCGKNTLSIGSRCIELGLLLTAILLPSALLTVLFVCLYLGYKRHALDTVWHLKPEELLFKDPPRVLGRGTFGRVLYAEFRGTGVAVKRIMPPRGLVEDPKWDRLLDQKRGAKHSSGRSVVSTRSVASSSKKSVKSTGVAWNLIELNRRYRRKHKSAFDFIDRASEENETYSSRSAEQALSYISDHLEMGIGQNETSKPSTASQPASSLKSKASNWFRQFSLRRQYSQLQRDFIGEMRHLSKLRHPCITTVMGAVISRKCEPMLVMECMELGSLHDLIHNHTMELEYASVVRMLRDIVRGLRFLHAADPQVVHGDLKSHNVLVDSKLRAKVADFGFSQKKWFTRNQTGTPFWMAPELLRGETETTPMSDMYSLGVILFEVFSRKEPYEGEAEKAVLRDVADPIIMKRPGIPTDCPKAMMELMKFCWRENPDDRPTSEEMDVRLKLIDVDEFRAPDSLSRSKSDGRPPEQLLYEKFPHRVANALRFGRKVPPKAFDCVTVCFLDIADYTELARTLPTETIYSLFERLYTCVDEVAQAHHVFRVETVGNDYMAVTNVAYLQEDHAAIMFRFIEKSMKIASKTLIDENNPSLGYVQLKAGMHSGPVVAQVLGTRRPRYSIIGDSVNTASEMESNSFPGRIQVSEATAELLREHAPSVPLSCRGILAVKGKGEMTTFWAGKPILMLSQPSQRTVLLAGLAPTGENADTRLNRFIQWNVFHLGELLKAAAIARTIGHETGIAQQFDTKPEELCETIVFPVLSERARVVIEDETGGDTAKTRVQEQLHAFIANVAHCSGKYLFHNFEQASHMTMFLSKSLQALEESTGQNGSPNSRLSFHPITKFAMMFVTLIRNIDHHAGMLSSWGEINPGNSMLTKRVARENALDRAWAMLMEPQYSELRIAIGGPNVTSGTSEWWVHFRQVLTHGVALNWQEEDATAREMRWETIIVNRQDDVEVDHGKSKALMEVLLNASVMAHQMQNWEIYRKWSTLLLREIATNANAGESTSGQNLYTVELRNFDEHVIPLARKLAYLGVLGEVGNEFARHATQNRDAWELEGKEIAEKLLVHSMK